MSITFEKQGMNWTALLDGSAVLHIDGMQDSTDQFEPLAGNAFRWTRQCAAPVTQMKLTLRAQYRPRYFQVPAVNYNGNGWGSGAQYYGYGDGNAPWTYAWHRVAIPACTYTESAEYAVALFGGEEGGMSCSVYPEGEETVQELLWPEVEGPKVLYKRFWEEPYHGVMEPRTLFSGIVMILPVTRPRAAMHQVLDFAWAYFRRDVKMAYAPERVRELDTLYFRQLWTHTLEGLDGFSSGMHWRDRYSAFIRSTLDVPKFEIGWVGQNAAVSCCLLARYLQTGERDLRHKALSVLDSWDRYAFLPNGLMLVNLCVPQDHLDSVCNGDVPVCLDACNLGTAATYYFKAAGMCEKAGIDRPSYRKRALGLCDFAVRVQRENGELAKTWFLDGSIDSPHGSVGCFLALPLFDAYRLTGEDRYRSAALKAVDFYLGEFAQCGHTTAGALDSNCIDKESAAPVLRGALYAYDLTKEQRYLEHAVDVGYYLATWQWHYSTRFPAGTLAGEAGFDTYGSTAVSAAHNALDHYGIYWIPEYLRLSELTGDPVWAERARALWYNGTQLLSDGTLVVNSRVRPAGSQDESIRHTRWARIDHRCFVPSEWLTNWQGTFRQMTLETLPDWDALR